MLDVQNTLHCNVTIQVISSYFKSADLTVIVERVYLFITTLYVTFEVSLFYNGSCHLRVPLQKILTHKKWDVGKSKTTTN